MSEFARNCSSRVFGLLRGRFGIKVCAVALLVSCVRLAMSQAPAPPPAAPPAVGPSSPNEGVDENGYKVWVARKFSKGEEGTYKNRLLKILTAPNPVGKEDATFFDAYYRLVSFPTLTQTSEESLRTLPDRRNRFFRTEIEACKDAETHARLVDLTLDQMQAVVQDNFHPAVRYNAMYIISHLNDQEVVRYGSATRVPEPMARALPVIFDEFKRPENSDAIKVAALIGLSRHLEWDPHRATGSTPIPAPQRAQIVSELLNLAQSKEPPAGRNAEGHLWFRRRAIEALGFAGFASPNAAVADALHKLLRDESEPLALRCTVASAIGRMNYQAPVQLDTAGTTKELGYLALVACDAELGRLANLKKSEDERTSRLTSSSAGGGGGASGAGYGFGDTGGGDPASAPSTGGAGFSDVPGAGGGGFGGQPAAAKAVDPKEYRFDFARRRLRQQLYSVQFGLTGGEDFIPGKPAVTTTVPGVATEKMPSRGMNAFAKAGNEKQLVTDVYAQVRALADVVENKASDLAQLDKELRKNMKPLEKLVGKKPGAPAVPAPGAPLPEAPVPPPAATPAAAGAAAASAPAAPMPAAAAAP